MRLFVSMLCLMSLLSACVPHSAQFQQRIAQPDTPPARNFTSFSASLRCMDGLLASANRPKVLITSTGIPDLTRRISVSGDDMLVNAISAMNRQSGAYIFVDQSLEKEAGQIAIFTPPKSGAQPTLYIRGSISQVDTPQSTNIAIDADDLNGTGDVSGGSLEINRGTSIVSVDMHLVSYPSKTVVPGSSVANSMVVTGRGFGLGGTGIIDLASLSSTIQIERIESMGQAVRNLIELGAIELIGRHANVQYWECLNIPATKTKAAQRKESIFSSADKLRRIPEAQMMLAQLGYYSGEITGIVDQRTRDALSHFQAKNRLIATGDLNYDTFLQLQERTRGFAPRRKVAENNGRFEDPKTRTLIITDVREAVDAANANQTARNTQSGFLGLFGGSKQKEQKLTLVADQRSHRVGDVFRAELVSPMSGYLTCFHQTNAGPITQIFPVEPNAAFAIAEGEKISLPDQNAGFDIQFETKGAVEKIMCLVEGDVQPADVSDIVATKAFGPVRASSFDAVRAQFQKKTKRLISAEISSVGR